MNVYIVTVGWPGKIFSEGGGNVTNHAIFEINPSTLCRPHDNRDFKIRYGEVLLQLREVKFTFGDVSTCVAVRLSSRSMLFYQYFVWRSLHYVFFQKSSLKIKYLAIEFSN